MEEGQKPGHGHRHWADTLFVLVISAVILMIVLEILSHFGAKDFVDRVAKQTTAALQNLNPFDLWERYLALWGSHLDYINVFASRHGLVWLSQVPGFAVVPLVLGSISGIAALLYSLLAETPIHASVDLLQIVVGCAAMLVLLTKMMSSRSVIFLILLINGGVLIGSLISVPTLWLMYLASSAMGDILPQAGISCYGGVCAGFIYGCTGRVFEGGLHHAISGVVERVVER